MTLYLGVPCGQSLRSVVCLPNIIRSFHEGMHAGVRVGADVSGRFEVRNGLRQG